jgi:hypothetical protein
MSSVSSQQAAFTALDTADFDAATPAECVVLLGYSRRLQGWIAAGEAKITSKLTEHHAAGQSAPAADAHTHAGGVSAAEARRKERRSKTINNAPGFGAALAEGAIGAEHVDQLATATAKLDDDVRAALFGMQDELLKSARNETPEKFGQTVRDKARTLEADNGIERNRQQRKQTFISHRVNHESGMHEGRFAFHPELGSRIFSAIDRQVARAIKAGAKRGESEFVNRTFDRNQVAAEALGTIVTTANTNADLNASRSRDDRARDDRARDDRARDDRARDDRARDHGARDHEARDHGARDHEARDHGARDHEARDHEARDHGARDDTQRDEPCVSSQRGGTSQPAHNDLGGSADEHGGRGQSAGVGQPDGHDNPADTGQPDGHDNPVSADQPDGHDNPVSADQPDGHDNPADTGQPGGRDGFAGQDNLGGGVDSAGRVEPAEVRAIEADITVIVDWATVTSGEFHDGSICETADGAVLPPESVRRLLCNGRITPVFLDSNGVPFNLGRTVRHANRKQRRALRAIYRGCGFPGCDVPFAYCEIHHITPWELGGATDLQNLIPICSRHHHVVHEGGWALHLAPDRTLTVTQPGSIAYGTARPDTRSGTPPDRDGRSSSDLAAQPSERHRKPPSSTVSPGRSSTPTAQPSRAVRPLRNHSNPAHEQGTLLAG